LGQAEQTNMVVQTPNPNPQLQYPVQPQQLVRPQQIPTQVRGSVIYVLQWQLPQWQLSKETIPLSN